jgi:hypothetical protein
MGIFDNFWIHRKQIGDGGKQKPKTKVLASAQNIRYAWR